jgi:hypothetical protein
VVFQMADDEPFQGVADGELTPGGMQPDPGEIGIGQLNHEAERGDEAGVDPVEQLARRAMPVLGDPPQAVGVVRGPAEGRRSGLLAGEGRSEAAASSRGASR